MRHPPGGRCVRFQPARQQHWAGRAPVAGRIVYTNYHAGKFFNASLDKAAEENERQNIVMQTFAGQKVGIVQIAGLVARRILLESAVGDELALYAGLAQDSLNAALEALGVRKNVA